MKEKWRYELYSRVLDSIPDVIRKDKLLGRFVKTFIAEMIDRMYTYTPLSKMNVFYAMLVGILVSKGFVDVVVVDGEVFVKLRKA